jgi:hypothetical protein
MNPELESRIRSLAHRFWEEEGHPQGREQEHWRRAQAALSGEEDAPLDNEATRIPERQQQASEGSRGAERSTGQSARGDQYGGDPDGAQSGQTKEQVFLNAATRRNPG